VTFSEKLQSLRREHGLSQEDLAERLGVSRQAVSKWELGQSYPETDKIVEICRMFEVTTDYLLIGGDDFIRKENKVIASPSIKKITILYIIIAALVILIVSAAIILLSISNGASLWDNEGSSHDESQLSEDTPIIPDKIEKLKEYYYDFALKYRIDYAPCFAANNAPKDSTEYLFFAFAINLDNWGEEKGKMTKQYVEDTILSYFGVTGINHLTLRKAWDYDGEKYTAYPDSVREPPLYILQEYATWEENGTQYYRVVMDRYTPENVLPSDEVKDAVLSGDFDGATYMQTEEIVYRTSIQNFGAPQFVSHTVMP